MKVLQVINNLGSGGAEKLLELIVPLMNEEENIRVDILLLTDEGNVYEESLNRSNVNVEVIKYNNIYDPRNIFRLVKHINEQDYDVVHSHVFPTQYWVAIVSLFMSNKKVKFITTEHNTNNRRRSKSFLKPLEKWVYSRYKKVISISNVAKNNLIKWLEPKPHELKNYIVIENGINLNIIGTAQPYAKENLIDFSSQLSPVFISMVGSFSEQKDQPTLIKAMKTLPDNYHVIFMGTGPLMKENISLATELGIVDRVHFLGFRSDMERILKTSDIIVLSTHWEGLSLASIEALASGKPFIASDVPGVKEVVKDRGLLFEEGNVDELVSHIITLMNDKELYNTVVQRSLEASKNYDINNMVSELLKIYKS